MPKKACKQIRCPEFATENGYCVRHQHLAPPRPADDRPSSTARGYDHGWRIARAKALSRARIPRSDWPLYAVDHNPPYNPDIEPDHEHYTLIPRLMSDHNRKTAIEDTPRDAGGRFARKGEGRSESLAPIALNRGDQHRTCDVKNRIKGSADE